MEATHFPFKPAVQSGSLKIVCSPRIISLEKRNLEFLKDFERFWNFWKFPYTGFLFQVSPLTQWAAVRIYHLLITDPPQRYPISPLESRFHEVNPLPIKVEYIKLKCAMPFNSMLFPIIGHALFGLFLISKK